MVITVTEDDVRDTAEEFDDAVEVTGTDETGARVRFAGDIDAMFDLFDEVEWMGDAEAYVEQWQIIE